MRGFQAAVRLLPKTLRADAHRLPEADKRRCEELRLRRGRSAAALINGTERTISDSAITEDDILAVMEAATRSSLHAAQEELCRGYLSAEGGVRVGVCGTAAGGNGLRAFSSLSIRVPRAVTGCSDAVWGRVTEGGFASLLIVSPPGAGKTTLLRDIVRRLSDGGTRVCVADERGEIADAAGGLPGFDVGACTDVMTGVPKARAARMLLRSMSPKVLAMDEITGEDESALLSAVGCGVRLLATAHGADIDEVRENPSCRRLFEARAFSRYAVVENRGGVRSYRVGTVA